MTKTEGYFEYKKLVKMLREKYGMVSLLRFLAQSGEADGKGETNLERLLEFVRGQEVAESADNRGDDEVYGQEGGR
jgi:hypothetical protein